MEVKTKDDFLMSPTVDYCFKELLAYPEIRKGFVAAVLNKDPDEIEETTLMPTILSKDTEDGKYGILRSDNKAEVYGSDGDLCIGVEKTSTRAKG